jgi:CheY-like chemotaxis protein
LGLATSYGIVRDAGGHFGVYSEVGVGTTMRVYLPRVDQGGDAGTEFIEAAPQGSLSATVLVLEDEDSVRRAAVRALEALGCRVLAASNGGDALEMIRTATEPIDLIFTDVVMPGMAGPEFVERVRPLLPNVKVLFTTGYTSDMAFRLKLLKDEVEVLAKPYSPTDLAKKIAGVLGR